MTENNKTLGFHRDMSAILFGEDSAATKFLDTKIAGTSKGREEEVIVPESQLIALLVELNRREAVQLSAEIGPISLTNS